MLEQTNSARAYLNFPLNLLSNWMSIYRKKEWEKMKLEKLFFHPTTHSLSWNIFPRKIDHFLLDFVSFHTLKFNSFISFIHRTIWKACILLFFQLDFLLKPYFIHKIAGFTLPPLGLGFDMAFALVKSKTQKLVLS